LALHALVNPERMCCRILVLDTTRDRKAPLDAPWSALSVGAPELTTAFAAAVHYGIGRHGLLIEAMQALLPPLTPLGRQFVSEVLASRFLLHRVAAIADALGVHRTRLHHRLVAAGDPSPKHLLDACYAIATVMMMRDPTCTTKDLLRFIRAVELRTPRDAVRRSTGMDLSSLRHLVRRDWGRTATSLILKRLVEGAGAHEECCSGGYPSHRSSTTAKAVAVSELNAGRGSGCVLAVGDSWRRPTETVRI
jgi:hypothetical protein